MNKYLYFQENDYELYKGKMQEVLSTFEEGSVDSIICDPPYELNFMGKGWDNSGVAFQKDTWEHCFKVLKEGGYLLAFGGSRTFHRIACAIEDAGFEIRDCIMWLYGSGFPKSMNIGLAIDKKLGVESEVVGKKDYTMPSKIYNINNGSGERLDCYETQPSSNLGKKYQGWGTCLKPAYEPIIVARKPFKCSLVENIMQNGVGGLNIDECRIPTSDDLYRKPCENGSIYSQQEKQYTTGTMNDSYKLGRFPANVILTYDETDYEEVCGGMPNTSGDERQTKYIENPGTSWKNTSKIIKRSFYNDEGSASRYFYCAKASKKDRDEGLKLFETKQCVGGGGGIGDYLLDVNSCSGKFGSEKAPHKNIHPTVKPVELMQYLVRLVSPKGATILDCFMGSGSTGKAVMFENRERQANYKFIGVEMTEEYLPICQSRIDYAKNKYEYELIKEKQEQQEKGIVDIFDFLEEEN